MNNKINKMKELIKKLNEASNLYYNSDKTIMTDKEWDSLFDELKLLENETNVIFSNSPTQNIGYEIKSKLNKINHSIPLKSLGKTKSIEDIKEFINNQDILFMLKGDGLTSEIIYENGEIKQGSTRGNGFIGEDITHNVRTFKNIPLKIKFDGYLKIAGESVIFDKDFEVINSKLDDKDKYSHSRNLVAGSVRQLNSKICNKRNVNFMVFSLLECKDKEGNEVKFNALNEQFNFLFNLGFQTIPFILFYSQYENKNKIELIIDDLKQFAKDKGIPIDGIVIKYNDLKYGLLLGETAHHPLNAIAYKFYNEEYETKYIRTEWQVSRTGTLNPVGIFKPVDLDGAIASRATLHNIDYFNSLYLGKGDIITVARMNEVIPKILNNKTKSNTEIIPDTCPICGARTQIKLLKTAHVLVCTNNNCSSKIVAIIQHYCSRDAMNIIGLSEATIEKFINLHYINDISDIYNLHYYKNGIINLEGFGQKSYDNLIKSIEKSKQCKLENFIYALGIPNVGKSTAKDLANCLRPKKAIDKFNLLRDMTIEILMKFKDMGEVTAKSIFEYFSDDKNNQIIDEILNEIEFIEEDNQQENKNGVFIGMKIYCTGTFANYKKAQLKEIVEKNGGTFANGYAKSLNMLVVGSIKGSSKVQKAEKDGAKIVSENEFIDMIK